MLSGGAPERGTVVGVSMAQGGVEAGRERKKKKKKKKERRSSFGGALLLKLHEVVDDGGVAVGTVGEKWRR
jgi:hypothetical protein